MCGLFRVASRSATLVLMEQTPNPDSAMFYPEGHMVLAVGAQPRQFTKLRHHVTESSLAAALFAVPGVDGIMLGARHVTVTKTSLECWSAFLAS